MNIPSFKDIKNWSPEIERQITENWKQAEQFNFNPKTKKKIYAIDTPPPYINTPIHIGHAATYSYMDFFARYKRMKGHEVLFPLGLDRNGLPIELAAEKKYNITPWKVGKEAFIEHCKKMLEETSIESLDSFAKLGISFSSYKESDALGAIYKTDAPDYRTLTQSTFISLFRKSLIYEANRINNWDPKLRTTIADAEIEYKDLPSTFNDIIFTIKETGEKITIGTTRPELICTCGMIIFNPEDTRYQHLEGKTAITPIFSKEVPIHEHPLAKMDKGTGLVMMCSAGDISDIQFFREMNLKPTIAINLDGTMNAHAGILQGLKVREAREKITEELKKESLLVKQAPIVHRTPVSERSGAEIEFIEMPEYYLKQLEYKDNLREIINKIDFYAPESKLILDRWIDAIAIDWPISRRRYYATPIPLWSTTDGLIALPPEGNYYEPWKSSPPADAEVFNQGTLNGKVSDFPKKEWKADERVLDTWFDSSISELYITHYQKNQSFFKKAFPVSLRPQGKEIVRTWLYYTILRGYLETKQPAFQEVWIHNHITDASGRKMSKSIGNVIDPQEILKQAGAEAFRFWAATEGDIAKTDLPCSLEKIKAEAKTMNKLLNVTRFILQFEQPKRPKIMPTDELFIEYIEDLTLKAEHSFENYDFHHPSLSLRHFIWELFASHYLELIKARAYNEQKQFSAAEADSAKYTLHFLLERLITLLYPIIPQITSVIAAEKKINLHTIEFPKAKPTTLDLSLMQHLTDFNSLVWKTKKEKSLSLKEPLSGIKIPPELEAFSKDLKACHNLI
ncbi:MAG TPA: valine--tRNA ligase [Candidatus Nanoarchaeia archaeon]|nr:valine--tRNA ligase [Candidatus Nanoarchaeia archaeon]